ncbi:MAG: 16S rRNA (cytidine(1402)-2'-O)-methyltransferase [Desulfuromonas sp.]|nr:MAG: 16S rRNA (cytidine(1402)-2'-O)-methyltransferase [Desulfuromonas sp.]
MLYLVATPIGNLEDMTFRAVRILKEVDLIACEDTRHSRKLLDHFQVSTPLTSFFEHNERDKGRQLLEKLKSGLSIALISDAGTPAISDPGYRLVRLCHEQAIPVTIIPGAQAAVSALAVSGLATDRFVFEGFLPAKRKGRCERLSDLANEPRTLVFYESPHRLAATLADVAEVFGVDRDVVVVRELTKLYEEICRGTAGDLVERWQDEKVRGEIVLLVAGAPEREPEVDLESAVRQALATGAAPKQISRELSKVYGLSGSDVYQVVLQVKQGAKVEQDA